jgi:hypothetical protein
MGKVRSNKVGSKIANVVAFISSIFSLFSDINPVFRTILILSIVVYSLIIITIVIHRISNVNIANKEFRISYLNSQSNLASKMHTYFHDLRDHTSDISSRDILTFRDVNDKSKIICTNIAHIFRTLFEDYLDRNDDVSVCIKLIKPESISDKNYKNWEMETISRSSTTPQERGNIDRQPVKISENSDFEIIISTAFPDHAQSIGASLYLFFEKVLLYNLPCDKMRQDEQ